MSKILPILIKFDSKQLKLRRIYYRRFEDSEEAIKWAEVHSICFLLLTDPNVVVETIETKQFVGYKFYSRREIDRKIKLSYNKKSIRLFLLDSDFDVESYFLQKEQNWSIGNITIIKLNHKPVSEWDNWDVIPPCPGALGVWKALDNYVNANYEIMTEDLIMIAGNVKPPATKVKLDSQEAIWFCDHRFWIASNRIGKYMMLLYRYYGRYKFWTNQRSFSDSKQYYSQPVTKFLESSIQMREHILHFSDFILVDINPVVIDHTKEILVVTDTEISLVSELEKLGWDVTMVTYDSYYKRDVTTVWCGRYHDALRMLTKGTNIFVDTDNTGRSNKIFQFHVKRYLEPYLDRPKDLDIVVVGSIYTDEINRAKIVVLNDESLIEAVQLTGALVVTKSGTRGTLTLSNRPLLQMRYLHDHYSNYHQIIEEQQQEVMKYTPEIIAGKIDSLYTKVL